MTVIGAGGIGSPAVLALAKMGVPEIIVWDDDSVEPHNLPNQMYRGADIGSPKVEALQATVQAFTGTQIRIQPNRFEPGQPLSGIVIAAVDRMDARATIWDAVKANIMNVQLFIDARMGAEVGHLYTIDTSNLDVSRAYERTLYSDEDAEELPCSAQAIIYTVFFMAALIASHIKKHCSGEHFEPKLWFDLVNTDIWKPERRRAQPTT